MSTAATLSGSPESTLASLVRPIASVHESVAVDRVLRQLRERRSHLALVVDEFGGTAGLLTLEDVLSELLGNVGDEFKVAEPIAETLPDGRVRIPGTMTVDDAASTLQTTWDSEATTVAGLVTEALGHLPAPGERVTVGAFEFETEAVTNRALDSVVVRRVAPDMREPD